MQPIATKMGLDTKKSSSLWKDRALVEVNIAVLHSFQVSLNYMSALQVMSQLLK